MKLIALVAPVVVLVGCAGTPDAPTTSSPTAAPSTAAASEWESKPFCDVFDAQRTAYQDALDSTEPVTTSKMEPFKEWADALKTKADADVAADVATFTGPLYLTENATVSLVDVFMAGNAIARYCITNG